MNRRNHRGLSLRGKTTLISLGIILLTTAIVAGIGIVQMSRQIAQEQYRSAKSVALGVARASELPLAVRDAKELNRLAKGFLRDPNVLFVAVYADAGNPIALATQETTAWQAFKQGQPAGPGSIIVRQAVDALSPAADEFNQETGGEPAPASAPAAAATCGQVVVCLSTAASQAALAAQSRTTLLVAIGAASCGAVVLFLTVGLWLRRLDRLAGASQALADGDFTVPLGKMGGDEIGRLAHAFDAMRASIGQRDQELRRFNDTLKDQVKARTAELEKALAAAEEASRAKSLFLANMSHELRTPLNGVVGMVELLMASDLSTQQRRYGEIAKSSARALLDLINDILDFSKIEAGKLELDPTDVDLWGIVDGVSQIAAERASKKGLELMCAVDHDVPRGVSVDGVRLRQVLLNLVSNAVKFTDKGEVVIQVGLDSQTPTHATVRFAVRDTGIGIPQDRLDRLFKSFSQVDASTTRKFGGTGLGLAISHRIVEVMGGQIRVSSTAGQGSTFSFLLTLPKAHDMVPTPRELPPTPRGLRVLVVDDNATNREILRTQLSSWGLEVGTAAGASEAMSALREAAGAGGSYTLAILDMNMPQTDGIQLAESIRQEPSFRDLIMISLSSLGDSLSAGEMKKRGFAACLTKPALPSSLYDAIVDSLAATDGDAIRVQPPVESPMKERFDGLSVLLVEDNDVNRLVATEIMGTVGCVCDTAENGRMALEQLAKRDYDVVLMDCQMPEMDGFEATRRLREEERQTGRARRRIIALTANAIKGDRELCLSAGMDGYLTKPIDPVALFDALREVPRGKPRPAAPRVSVPAAAAAVLAVRTPAGPASPGTTPAESVIDVKTLKERCLGNRALAAKALRRFDANVGADLQALFDNVRSGAATDAAAAAHKIKGSAANVSAQGVGRVAAELEQLARQDALSQAETSLAELERQLQRFRDELPRTLGDLDAAVQAACAAR